MSGKRDSGVVWARLRESGCSLTTPAAFGSDKPAPEVARQRFAAGGRLRVRRRRRAEAQRPAQPYRAPAPFTLLPTYLPTQPSLPSAFPTRIRPRRTYPRRQRRKKAIRQAGRTESLRGRLWRCQRLFRYHLRRRRRLLHPLDNEKMTPAADYEKRTQPICARSCPDGLPRLTVYKTKIKTVDAPDSRVHRRCSRSRPGRPSFRAPRRPLIPTFNRLAHPSSPAFTRPSTSEQRCEKEVNSSQVDAERCQDSNLPAFVCDIRSAKPCRRQDS
ncbi:hypothetical protein C8F01DRAFT_1190842 [Mycena amicta]|nr:hypothetical protein C8F01DRAFT_1190842 [Mycena amicta]